LRFRKRIYSTNEAIENGALLQNRITRNSKILDSKSPEVTEGYDSISHVEDWESNYSNYLYDNTYYSLNTYLDDAGDNVYYNKGYFFFDYEKAWRQTSELSQYINVNKLCKLWGLLPVYSKFRVNEAKLIRMHKSASDYTILRTYLHTNTQYAKSQYYNWSTNATTDSLAGVPENSYVVLRNFLPVEELPWAFGSDEIDNYHLMCFEFKDEFGTYSPDVYDEYDISVEIDDNSLEVLCTLVDHYYELYEDLESYFNSSKEDCAHDTETGDFKPFFIDAMDNLYGEALETSPWYRAAVLYNMHRDLLFNTFDGDWEALIENAEEIVDTIGPYTGNQFSLEVFVLNFIDLYNDNYSSLCEETTIYGEAPVADAGVDQLHLWDGVAPSSMSVMLDGTASYDPEGEDLTYSWTLTSVPTDSVVTTADIINADTANAEFHYDKFGDYEFTLTVSDGYSSDSDSVIITIEDIIDIIVQPVIPL